MPHAGDASTEMRPADSVIPNGADTILRQPIAARVSGNLHPAPFRYPLTFMLRKLRARWSGRPVSRISDHDWQRNTSLIPFLGHLDDDERRQLRGSCENFLAGKQFSGAAGFEVGDDICLQIAIQACLPVLHLPLRAYDDFVGIIVYPDRFIATRQETDEAGVVHEFDDELAGEAMEGGPVVLSWPDADPRGSRAGYNVVIHEFVHKLDLLDGFADGAPPMPRALRPRWMQTMSETFADLQHRLDAIERAIPPDVDPESPAAEAWYDQLPVDPYAATDPGEFFAVASETFFTAPQQLCRSWPQLYALFRDYFGQNPLSGARPL